MAYQSINLYDGKNMMRSEEISDSQLQVKLARAANYLEQNWRPIGFAKRKATLMRAGATLKKSTLELGGSDAFIVLEDADLEKAVKQAVIGRMGNSGQACTASKRIFVLEAVADAFQAKFTAAMKGFRAGKPMEKRTTLAPLSSAQAMKKLLAQIDTALSHGASLLLGGKPVPGQFGKFMETTILTGINNKATAVATLIDKFDSINVVLNNVGYGLAGPPEAATPEQVQRPNAAIVFGPTYTIQACPPHSRARKSGLFINYSIGNL